MKEFSKARKPSIMLRYSVVLVGMPSIKYGYISDHRRIYQVIKVPVLSSGDVRSSQFISPGDFDSSREYDEHRSSAKLSGWIRACVPIVRFNHLGEPFKDSGLANFLAWKSLERLIAS
jgi:hypothetical protein